MGAPTKGVRQLANKMKHKKQGGGGKLLGLGVALAAGALLLKSRKKKKQARQMREQYGVENLRDDEP